MVLAPPMLPTRSRIPIPIRPILLTVGLGAAITIFLAAVHPHYAIEKWLFWRYLVAIGCAFLWATSCASAGCFLLDRFGIRSEQRQDALVLAFPLGVFAFQLTIFLLGLAHLLGPITFLALPLAFLLAGASNFWKTCRGLGRAMLPRSPWDLALTLFGAAGIGLIYFQVLSPEPFSWDARWYHLPIAQQYAKWGAVRAFPEGWWLASYPHSASLTYTWAFLLPESTLFDRLELCAHLEMAVFLGTIAGIPALVRALVPELSGRNAWVALFLFPAVFLYDGNLHAGADHMAAVFCIPLALTLIRLWNAWTVRNAVLFCAFLAAGMLTKYSAWAMLVFPSCLFLVRAAYLGLDRFRSARASSNASGAPDKPILPAFVAGGAAVLVLSAPHWLKNWIWYGDPMYPVLRHHLSAHPWSVEAPAMWREFMGLQMPPKPGWDGVIDALLATLTFSFKPNDWSAFHRDVPIFGSLFTLSFLCLPFVRAGARLWLGYIGVTIAIFAWYMTNHQDRYLQVWLPFMAGATFATLQMAWRQGPGLVRVLVGALVSIQVIWGGDVPFFPTHNIAGDSPIRLTSRFLASGFLRSPHRLRAYDVLGEMGERLPPDANVLLHEVNLQMGLDTLVVNDQWQGRISYSALRSPAAIHRELSEMGVTHLLWKTATMSGWNAAGGDLAFLGFAMNYAEDVRTYGEWTLARFPARVPPSAFNDTVAVSTCGGPYRSGLYGVAKLTVPEPGEAWAGPDARLTNLESAAANANFLLVDPGCTQVPEDVARQFHPPVSRQSLRMYVRNLRQH